MASFHLDMWPWTSNTAGDTRRIHTTYRNQGFCFSFWYILAISHADRNWHRTILSHTYRFRSSGAGRASEATDSEGGTGASLEERGKRRPFPSTRRSIAHVFSFDDCPTRDHNPGRSCPSFLHRARTWTGDLYLPLYLSASSNEGVLLSAFVDLDPRRFPTGQTFLHENFLGHALYTQTHRTNGERTTYFPEHSSSRSGSWSPCPADNGRARNACASTCKRSSQIGFFAPSRPPSDCGTESQSCYCTGAYSNVSSIAAFNHPLPNGFWRNHSTRPVCLPAIVNPNRRVLACACKAAKTRNSGRKRATSRDPGRASLQQFEGGQRLLQGHSEGRKSFDKTRFHSR